MKSIKKIITTVVATSTLAFSAMTIAGTELEKTDVDNTKQIKTSKFIKPLTMYNFAKNKEVRIKDPKRLSVDEAREFIPQIEESFELFDVFIEKGAGPMEAITYTYLELMSVMKELDENK